MAKYTPFLCSFIYITTFFLKYICASNILISCANHLVNLAHHLTHLECSMLFFYFSYKNLCS